MKFNSYQYIAFWVLALPIILHAQPPANLPIPQEQEQSENSPKEQTEQANAQLTTRYLVPPKPGQPCDMEFCLKNPGTVPMTEIQLKQEWNIPVKILEVNPKPLIQGKTWVWDLLDLQPGSGKVFSAKITFEGDTRPEFRPTISYTPNHLHKASDKSGLFVQVNGPQFVRKGNKAVFDIIVANQGKAPVQQVTIRDKLPEGLRHPEGEFIEAELGNIPPGGKKSIRLETLAVQTGRFSQDIQVASSNGDKKLYQSEISVGENQIQLKWQKSLETPAQGTLEMVLESSFESGARKPENHALRVEIPKGLELVEVTPFGLKNPLKTGETELLWQNPPVLSGNKFFARFKLRATTPGDWNLHAKASMQNSQDATSSFLIRVEGSSEITGKFSQPKIESQHGKEFKVQYFLHNMGTAGSQNASVKFQIPDGLFPISWNGPTVGGAEGEWIIFDPVTKIAANQNLEYSLIFKSLRPGEFKLSAELNNGTVAKPTTCTITANPQP